ncbi:phage tail assembly chaperone, partial [Pantoea ananatis]
MQFEIKGIRYSARKLSVFDQLKVSRKLLPVLAGLLGDFQALRESSQGGDVSNIIEKVLPKIADAVAGL